jgi:signal peptidase I|tara:strand:+ start:229 stop:645 length:417 start_codon:yes stop_codon:yes gene_type:complete
MIFLIGLANISFRYVFPTKPVKLASGNMEPTYSKGDVIFYTQSEDYKVDDIILHETSRAPSVVRIIEINQDGTFKAKGDANPTSISRPGLDETRIPNEKIIGKVSFGTKSFVFYPLMYGIEIILALLLTILISKKIKK